MNGSNQNSDPGGTVTKPDRHLDYGRSRLPTSGKMQQRLIVVAGCFAVSWLAWLVIGLLTYDAFDDELMPWLGGVTGVFGTPCGAILSVPCLLVTDLHLRHWLRQERP